MTWHVNDKDSATNQKYYQINGIYTISKTIHNGKARYTLWKGGKKIGTFDSFNAAERKHEELNEHIK